MFCLIRVGMVMLSILLLSAGCTNAHPLPGDEPGFFLPDNGSTGQDESFRTEERTDSEPTSMKILYGAYFGFILIVLLFNLTMPLIFKESINWFYLCYVFTTAVTNSCLEGWFLKSHESFILFYSLSGFFLVLFVLDFFNIKRTCQRGLFWVFIFAALAHLLPFCTGLIPGLLSSGTVFITIPVVSSLFLFSISIRSWIVHGKLHSLHQLGLLFFVVSLIVFIGMGVGFLPSNAITAHSLLIGSTIEILFFILALAGKNKRIVEEWQVSEIKVERIEKALAAADFENLKKQIGPHFLLNCMNTLSHLLYEDKRRAEIFIKHLSQVYRHLLKTRREPAISIGEEVDFVRSYMYLQKIRFGDRVQIRLDIKEHTFKVVPIALQMLIENAIKHNEVSDEKPLIIKVYHDALEGFLAIENSLQPKLETGPSCGIGLDNIKKRYSYLTDRTVEVIKTTNHFIVKLPVLCNTETRLKTFS